MKKKKPHKIEKQEKNPEELEFEKLSKFFDNYIYNGDLITKTAIIYGLDRITYIKGKDLKQFFIEKFSEIQKEILSITNINLGKEPDKNSLQKFYEINQKRNIFHYLQRFPGDKAKYPKKLLPLKKTDDINLDLNFSETGFYILQIKVEKTNKPIIYLILLIILILFIVMFPIWPLKVKLGVLYLLMGLLIFMITFLILTIIIAIIGILFGYDIDIMPNLDDNKKTLYKRLFKPFIIIEKREDPLWFFIVRIVTIISLIIIGFLLYYYKTININSWKSIKNYFGKLISYGKKKVEDFHYNRNSIKLSEKILLENLENF